MHRQFAAPQEAACVEWTGVKQAPELRARLEKAGHLDNMLNNKTG
jgi:hypothetical protein